jgi:adenine-specific DNA-methyltransferase
MRFIGNKENIIDKIYQVMLSRGVSGKSLFDFFSGTSNVGQYFKNLGYSIYSSDLMYFSFVLQKAYIENNEEPLFTKLLVCYKLEKSKLFCSNLDLVINHLNSIEPIQGFIYNNYTPEGTAELDIPRMYFSSFNGAKIDAIRLTIEQWQNEGLITSNEYYILIACLIETVPFYANISGVYAAFHKKWDPRAIKKMVLRTIVTKQGIGNYEVFNVDSVSILDTIKADVFYLDPPYNHRQYAPNYHLLETIAKYDYPTIKGVAGLREYQSQKSKFCTNSSAILELDKIAKDGNFKFLVMSYNSEGVMSNSDIISTLSKYGKVSFDMFEYPRYKSNNNGESKSKKYIQEHLYILQK